MEPPEAESLWRWNSDPEVMRWIDGGYPESLAQVAENAGAIRVTRSSGSSRTAGTATPSAATAGGMTWSS
ncbi:hypothetical protein [Streptosporangium roseum]|uniref:hypothetical protein n=1 Tax=Streptosporangium roseum TaxID=2001 RepID=UPI001C54F38D|nr:hypothetical protein [Streptosporangium roseum]